MSLKLFQQPINLYLKQSFNGSVFFLLLFLFFFFWGAGGGGGQIIRIFMLSSLNFNHMKMLKQSKVAHSFDIFHLHVFCSVHYKF